MQPPRPRPARLRPTWLLPLAALLAAGLLQPRPGASRSEALTLRFEEPPVNLSGSPETDSENPRVAVSGDGTVHVVWQEYAPGSLTSSNLLARHRRPGGAFAPADYLARAAQDPSLVAWGQTGAAAAYAAGRPGNEPDSIDFKILLHRWDEASGSWARRGEAVPTGDGGVQPALTRAENRFWLSWVDTSTAGERRPQYAALRDDPTPEPIGDTLSLFDDDVQSPQIARASDGAGATDIHIAWMNSYGQESELSHLWLPADAPTPAVNRDLGSYYLFGQARRPALSATRREQVCLAWQEAVTQPGSFRQDIIQMCSPWDAPVNLSDSSTASGEPSLVLDDQLGAMVLWQERLVPRIQEEIRFLQGRPPRTSMVYSGTASMPHIAFDPARRDVHAVWVAETPAGEGSEIFYARWRVDPATPTPSATPRPSASPSPASPTPTLPPELTPTPLTPTITPTPSRTPTASRTPTPSATPADQLFAPALLQHRSPLR